MTTELDRLIGIIENRINGPHDKQGRHYHCVECKTKRELKKILARFYG